MIVSVGAANDHNVRIWLDGVDVSNDCFYADDARGVVRVYKRHNGNKYLVGGPDDPNGTLPGWPVKSANWPTLWHGALVGRAATEERSGVVRIEIVRRS